MALPTESISVQGSDAPVVLDAFDNPMVTPPLSDDYIHKDFVTHPQMDDR